MPNSKAGKREVPLPRSLVGELHALTRGRTEILFPSRSGSRLDIDNVRRQVIAPAAEEAGRRGRAGTPSATPAHLLIVEGRNIVQVQRWLGHSSPDVTWRRYAHLMPGELGDALELDGLLAAPAVELLGR